MWKSAGRAPSLRILPWYLPYNWGKSMENLIQGKKNISQVKKNLGQSTKNFSRSTKTSEYNLSQSTKYIQNHFI